MFHHRSVGITPVTGVVVGAVGSQTCSKDLGGGRLMVDEEHGLQLQLGRGKQLGSMLPTAHMNKPSNRLETSLTH